MKICKVEHTIFYSILLLSSFLFLLFDSMAPSTVTSSLPPTPTTPSTEDRKNRQLSHLLASIVRQTDFLSDCFLAPNSLAKQTPPLIQKRQQQQQLQEEHGEKEERHESGQQTPTESPGPLSSDSLPVSHIASIASSSPITMASRTQAYHLQVDQTSLDSDDLQSPPSPAATELQTTSLLFEGFEMDPSGRGLVRLSSRRLNVRHETHLHMCPSSLNRHQNHHRPKSRPQTNPSVSLNSRRTNINRILTPGSEGLLGYNWLSLAHRQNNDSLLVEDDNPTSVKVERVTTIQLLDEMDPTRPAVSIEMCDTLSL